MHVFSFTFVLMLSFLGLSREAGALSVGDEAPRVSSRDQNGAEVQLADVYSRGPTLVYFYPKADSPGCTTQACAFRDTINKIKAKDAVLIGVSTDTKETQKAFHEKHKLNFDLLSDAEGKATSEWGIKVPLMGIAKRWTFIIDKNLIVRSVEPDVDPAFDAKWTADALEELQNPPKEGSEEDVK
jgi:peroxiredoxin Q/BCP